MRLNRVGEVNYNSFGSEMIIVKYDGCMNINVFFPEYNWTAKNRIHKDFKVGKISCPYERRTWNIGFIGEGKYEVSKDGNTTRCYDVWQNMIQRCYDKKFQEKYPTYKNCNMPDEWLNFQNFAEWYEKNYYEIPGEIMCLDKDILIKRNKTYSPETCVFVSNRINNLFVKNDGNRGKYPIGVNLYKRTNKYRAYCNIYDKKTKRYKNKHLGYFSSVEEAFKVYKEFKEEYIKQVANEVKEYISKKLYDAMYKYEVEIND
jgi:hypothetical protein